MVQLESHTCVLEPFQWEANQDMSIIAAGNDDGSSVFLSSSDDLCSVEGLEAAPHQCISPAGLEQDAERPGHDGRNLRQASPRLVSALSSGIHSNAVRVQQPPSETAGRSHPLRPPGPFLWRLFPRCIRATTEVVCIATEATLNVAPSECQVTVVKEGVKLPVRLDFLNDRQATGEDSDQIRRHGRGTGNSRGAMQAIAAWQRHVGQDHVNHVLRSHRPDSELVLIWVTPGLSPGLMLIELHAPPLISSSGGGGGANSGSSGSAPAPPQLGAASTGALESAWRSHATGTPPPPVGGIREAMANIAGRPIGPEAAATPSGGDDVSRTLIGGPEAGGRQAGSPTVSISRGQVFGLSTPGRLQRGERRWGRIGTDGDMRSSGALTVVVVPDAGMESEICALLAMQYQQLPLPVTNGCSDGALDEEPATSLLHQYPRQQLAIATGAGPSGSAQPMQDNGGGTTNIADASAAGSPEILERTFNRLLTDVDDDNDDARARERFLWDLGAWLEFVMRTAEARRIQALTTRGTAAVVAAIEANPSISQRALSQTSRGYDQAHQHSLLRQQLQPQRVLGDLEPEIEPIGEAPYDFQQGPWTNPRNLVACVPRPGTGERFPTVPKEQSPIPQTALELLGFACSRGWAATSTNIVLGLMDMGHSMHAINAAVQGAHGWSALHLAVASGSAELVAMTALWRSYGRYGDGPAVQDEWRGMLAMPGPGGLTPLHLAAVLPQPATATLDLLSTLPDETLTTWFGEAACDGCTPAHYASRAGNAHLNEHALLCLATGTSALDLDTAHGLQEVLPYLNELQADLSNITCSESADLEGGTQEVPSIGAHIGVGAAAIAPSSNPVNPNRHAPPPPSPSASVTLTFESASEGGLRAPASLVDAGVDEALLVTARPYPGNSGGGAAHGSDNAAAVVANHGSSKDVGVHFPVRQAEPTPATPLPQTNSAPSRDSIVRIDSINPVHHSTGGGFRSAMRSLIWGSAARAVSTAAMLTMAKSSKATSSSSLRGILPRLRGRFQCLGGGAVVGSTEGDASGHGAVSNTGRAASARSCGPSLTPTATAVGSVDFAAERSTQVPPDTKEGLRQEGLPSSSMGQQVFGGSSSSSSKHDADGKELQSIPSTKSYGQVPAQPMPPSQLLQSSTAVDAASQISNSTLGNSGGRSNTATHQSRRSSVQNVRAQLVSIINMPNNNSSHRTHNELQPNQARTGSVCSLGESCTPGPQLPAHGSPALLSRATDSSAWSPEPWTSQKRVWPEPSNVVAELLDHVSPGVSTRGSCGTTSQSWSTGCSQQPVFGLRNRCGSLNAAAQSTAAQSTPTAPAALGKTIILSSMGAEQARLLATTQLAAATVARNISASAPAGGVEIPLTDKMGPCMAATSAANSLATATVVAAAAGEGLSRSAPPSLGGRLMLDLIRPLCHVTLRKQLLHQAIEHRRRVCLQLTQAAQRLQILRPRSHALLALQLPQLRAMDTGEPVRRTSQRGGMDACSECLPQQQKQKQQRATSPSPERVSPAIVRSSATANNTAVADSSAQPPGEKIQNHVSLLPDADGSVTLGQHVRAPLIFGGAAAGTDASLQAAAAAVAIERGDWQAWLASTVRSALPKTDAAIEAEAANPALAGAVAAKGGKHCGGEGRLHTHDLLAAGVGASAVLALLVIPASFGTEGVHVSVAARHHATGPEDATLSSVAAACSWGLLALAWPTAITSLVHRQRLYAPRRRTVLASHPATTMSTLSTRSGCRGNNRAHRALRAAVPFQLADLAVHCVLLVIRMKAGLRFGLAQLQPWQSHEEPAPHAEESNLAGASGSTRGPKRDGRAEKTLVGACSSAGTAVVDSLELLSALLVGTLMQMVISRLLKQDG